MENSGKREIGFARHSGRQGEQEVVGSTNRKSLMLQEKNREGTR